MVASDSGHAWVERPLARLKFNQDPDGSDLGGTCTNETKLLLSPSDARGSLVDSEQ